MATVSPFTGWPSNAVPVAVQSFSVPSSKSRLSGFPSLPTGLMGGLAGFSARAGVADAEIRNDARTKRQTDRTTIVVFGILLNLISKRPISPSPEALVAAA